MTERRGVLSVEFMKVFEQGARVIRQETGQRGTVRQQFIDGYVALTFDDGRLAELHASGLKKMDGEDRTEAPGATPGR